MSGAGFFYSPEDQEGQDALLRKQAYAQALLKQGNSDPGNGAFGGLRNAGNSILGAFLSNRVAGQEKDFATALQDKRSKALASILNPQATVPDQVSITPQTTNQAQFDQQKAAGAYAPPHTPTTAEALANSGDPGLMQEFAPSLIQHSMTRADQLQDYTRDRADKAMRPATPQEKATAGLNPNTPAMVDAFGAIKPITDPNQITAYQQAELKQQQATLGETSRHNKADENAKLHPFGIGGAEGTGDALLAALPPGIASQVKAIATYRQAPPASRSAQSMALMSAVNQYDPTYDQTMYGAKSKARNDFSVGKNGNTVRSLNVAVQHLDQLGQLSEAMGNGDVQAFNKIGNVFAAQTGKAAPTNFNAAKQLVGDEIVKAIVGAGGGVGDREEAAHNISSASSPQQLAGVIKTYQGLLSGQLVGLKQQYEKSTGLKDFEDYLAPETKAKLENHSASQSAAPSGSNNRVIRYDAQGKRLP